MAQVTDPQAAEPNRHGPNHHLPNHRAYVFGHRPLLTQIRALAVVLVVLFHAGVIEYGFIGVDVFFVLSGFLVSNVLWDAMTHGTPMRRVVVDFVTRRVKRLLPLSLLVTALTALVAPFVYDTLIDTWRESARASVLWSQNWFLIGEANDYFAPQGANPFQHYWSLGVEEQFYVALPLLAAAVAFATGRRATRRAFVVFGAVVVAGALASIAVNLWSSAEPSSLYFATHARAYQLLAGCAVMAFLRVVPMRSAYPSVVWCVGLVLVGLGTVGELSLFARGVATTVATATLILGAERVELDAPVIERMGLWSYGIYLWHYPINEYLLTQQPSLGSWTVFGIVAVLSTLLAAASFRWFEQPLRRSSASPGRAFALTGLVVVAMVTAVSFARDVSEDEVFARGDAGEGLTIDLDVDEVSPAAASTTSDLGADEGSVTADPGDDAASSTTVATTSPPARLRVAEVENLSGWVPLIETSVATCGHWDTEAACVDTEGEFTVLLLGDSFANRLYHGLRALAEEEEWRFGSFVRPGCPWLLDAYLDGSESELCQESKPLFGDVMAHMQPDVVVLHSYPHVFLERIRRFSDGESIGQEEIIAEARRSIDEIQATGAAVVFVESTPFAGGGFNSANCLEVAEWADECDFDFLYAEDPMAAAMRADALTDARLDVATINDILCEGGRCSATVAGLQVMTDTSHVSGGVWVVLRERLLDQSPLLRGEVVDSVTG